MHTSFVQRWRRGSDRYRPANESIQTQLYEVASLPADRIAKAFVLDHHYAGTYPAARFRFGLYRGGELQGVAVFSHPCNDAVLTRVFPALALECVELGRFVLLDEVPANGETWFLGRCFEQLRGAGIVGVLSFADPHPRTSSAGRVVFGGHVGTIYQTHNGAYLGRSRPRTLRLLPDGSILSDRAIQKLRSADRGWRYVAETLVRAGAEPPAEAELPDWARRWVTTLTRPSRHCGNHRYAWGLTNAIRKSLRSSSPYPKWPLPA
jgi:hypothetical protein